MAIVERRAVCFLACRPDGKILGIYRNNNPIGWGLVGGKVDPGETDEIAVAREANEEAGITVTAIQKVFERTSQVRRTSDGQEEIWIVSTFQGLFTGELKSSDEGRVAWVSMYDLIDGPFGIYNRALFETMGCEI